MEKFFAANKKLPSAPQSGVHCGRLGSECDVDTQGRVTVNSELAAELGLDNQELHVQPYKLNRIRILVGGDVRRTDGRSRRTPTRSRTRTNSSRRGVRDPVWHNIIRSCWPSRWSIWHIRPDGTYLDCTAGLGGHTRAIAARLTEAGTADLERSRSAVARDGARERGGVLRTGSSFSMAAFSELQSHGTGRPAGGSGSEPVSADRSGARIFISGGWAAGHAHGSNAGHDGGRSAEPQCRKGNRRLALPARRRKESAEDSQSNRSSAAHSEHTTPGGCSGTGRTSDGTYSSRDSYFHGIEDGGQSGTGRAGRAAGSARRAW